ncbi:uncharacterized protein LOC133926186 [Phragmites australis]|uniref:uncharacterized protein LOC133926186 n=1 Tax=Phragmites australis TaxID=29695 RepID=UPI002D775A46|nr:uncharacterized protein LOC133926186 [Phragmites australis]
MPSGSTHALALAPTTTHRGGEPEHPAHCLLLERMAPLRLAGAAGATTTSSGRRLTRLLVNVTVDRSLWPVHLVLGADATVADLVRAAVAAYVREGRRPPLPAGAGGDAADGFELHFSKYSLESLRPEEKVLDLGSRNFFLCARRSSAAACSFDRAHASP